MTHPRLCPTQPRLSPRCGPGEARPRTATPEASAQPVPGSPWFPFLYSFLISHEIQTWFHFSIVGLVVFIFSDKKLGVKSGRFGNPQSSKPCSRPTGFSEELRWHFSLEARPSSPAPRSLPSDLGEAAVWMAAFSHTPAPGGPARPEVSPGPLKLSGSPQAGLWARGG